MYKTANNVTILILIPSNEVQLFYKQEKYNSFSCKNSMFACMFFFAVLRPRGRGSVGSGGVEDER